MEPDRCEPVTRTGGGTVTSVISRDSPGTLLKLLATRRLHPGPPHSVITQPALNDPSYVRTVVTGNDLKRRFHPEARVAGFSHLDGTFPLYLPLLAELQEGSKVLDFGAGRGGQVRDDPIPFRRQLKDLRSHGAYVIGVDMEEAVLSNEFVDEAHVVAAGEKLPLEDNSIDVVLSRWVFEHIEDPSPVASEFHRVLKPGGRVYAVTPNKWGYIAIFARMVPNRFHARALARIQPKRKDIDVFPTAYLLNTTRDLRRHFGSLFEIEVLRTSNEPSYSFGSAALYRLFLILDRFTPTVLKPCMYVYLRKPV